MNYTEYIEWLDRNLKSQAVINEKDCIFRNVKEEPFDIYGLHQPKEQGEFFRVPKEICQSIGAGME